jgi:hypothetical protein
MYRDKRGILCIIIKTANSQFYNFLLKKNLNVKKISLTKEAFPKLKFWESNLEK